MAYRRIYDMMLETETLPGFGSITQGVKHGEKCFYLKAADIPKLNSALTRAALSQSLVISSGFSIKTGTCAYVTDWITARTGSCYVYQGFDDTWYEAVPYDI